MQKEKRISRVPAPLKYLGVAVFWLMVWWILAIIIHNPILVATPFATVKAMLRIIAEKELLITVSSSLWPIVLGLAMAVVLALALVVISYKSQLCRTLLAPFVLCVKTVPVASFVIILLIWQGAARLSMWIGFLIAFPVIYTNLLQGLDEINISSGLMRVARLYKFSVWDKLWHVYRPSLRGYFLSAMRLAVGMAVKAGVAAQIIGLPDKTFGEKMYMAKIYLSTDELFAWTIYTVVFAYLLEKVILILTRFLCDAKIVVRGRGKVSENISDCQNRCVSKARVELSKVSVTFDSKKLFDQFDLKAEAGVAIGIMSPSGTGKTTIFNLITGELSPTAGSVLVDGRVTAVFQEPFLCENLNGYDNLKLVSNAYSDLDSSLLNPEDMKKKVSSYSLGMKRRLAIMRALSTDFDILLLDEPFASLDDTNRIRAVEYIKERVTGKTVIMFTHNEEDIALLNGVKRSI